MKVNPIKVLGTQISYDKKENNNLIFFVRIKKMETKLNIWLARDLTLMGRTRLSKTLGNSNLVYTASTLSVPKKAI